MLFVREGSELAGIELQKVEKRAPEGWAYITRVRLSGEAGRTRTDDDRIMSSGL